MKTSQALFWIALLVAPALSIGLPLGWGFSQFYASANAPIHGSHMEPSTAPANQNCCQIHEEGYWEHLGNDPVGSATLLLCLVTTALAIYTALLYRTTRQLANDAHRTARDEFSATHRPLLRPRYFVRLDMGPNDQVFRVRFTVFSSGDVPAIMYRCGATIEFFERDRLPPPMFLGLREALAPQRFERGQVEDATASVSRAGRDLGNLALQGFDLHVFGLIEYRDDAGRHRTTAFCRRLDWRTNRFHPVDDADYEYED